MRLLWVWLAVVMIPLTVANSLCWRWIPCEWHQPYR